MAKTKGQYNKLMTAGEKLWREGNSQDSARAYFHAALSAHSLPERAKAYALAGTMFGLAKDADCQKVAKLRSARLWSRVAKKSPRIHDRVDAYWQAFLQVVAIKDTDAQASYMSKLTDTVRGIELHDLRLGVLQRLLKDFPAAGSANSEHILQHELAHTEVEQAHVEVKFEKKAELLREGLDFYRRSGDENNAQATLSMLQEEYRRQGEEAERAALYYQDFEDIARAYEGAAASYATYCPTDKERCVMLAAEMRAKAEQAAQTVVGVSTASMRLEHALSHKEANEHNIPFNSWSLGIYSDKEYVLVRSHSFGLTMHVDAHSEFYRTFADVCGIDMSDQVIKKQLLELTTLIGETDSYCPTPDSLPQWIITTRFRKIALTLVVGTLTGVISGVTVGGLNSQAVLAGVVGVHAAIIVNLISAYLLMPTHQKETVAALLKKHMDEPATALVILELNKRPQTIRELCVITRCSEGRVRRIIEELKREGTVEGDATKPVLWKLVHTLFEEE